MTDRLDYRRPGVFSELADSFGREFDVRPGESFGHVTCGPEWSWRFRHSDYDLWLVLRGRGMGCVGRQRLVVGPGTVLVLRPGDSGSFVQDPNDRLTVTYTHFDFVVPGTRAPTDVPAARLPSRFVQLGDVRAVSDPLLSVVRLLEQAEPLAGLEARLRLAQVLVTVCRQDAESLGLAPKTLDPRVEAVMRYVRDRPSERPSLAESAAVARVSPGRLRRLFAREVGTSYRSFLLRARMEKARALLNESTMSVSEVARILGYADVVLFSRQVRKHFGKPPRDLRRSR